MRGGEGGKCEEGGERVRVKRGEGIGRVVVGVDVKEASSCPPVHLY